MLARISRSISFEAMAIGYASRLSPGALWRLIRSSECREVRCRHWTSPAKWFPTAFWLNHAQRRPWLSVLRRLSGHVGRQPAFEARPKVADAQWTLVGNRKDAAAGRAQP